MRALNIPAATTRIDLPVRELLQLTALADRGIEMFRFEDEDQALAGAFAVERLEQAIPDRLRPFDLADNRQALIRHWWPLERKSA